MRENVKKRMQEFDQIFKECGVMPSYMGHFLGYIIEMISYSLFSSFLLDPGIWDEAKTSDLIMFLICVFWAQRGVKLHINTRIQVKEEGNGEGPVTVYDYLKYVPISPQDIFYIRVQYLLGFILRRLILLYLIQGIVFVARHYIVWKVTVVPFGYMLLVFMGVLLEIKPNNTKKR